MPKALCRYILFNVLADWTLSARGALAITVHLTYRPRTGQFLLSPFTLITSWCCHCDFSRKSMYTACDVEKVNGLSQVHCFQKAPFEASSLTLVIDHCTCLNWQDFLVVMLEAGPQEADPNEAQQECNARFSKKFNPSLRVSKWKLTFGFDKCGHINACRGQPQNSFCSGHFVQGRKSTRTN